MTGAETQQVEKLLSIHARRLAILQGQITRYESANAAPPAHVVLERDEELKKIRELNAALERSEGS